MRKNTRISGNEKGHQNRQKQCKTLTLFSSEQIMDNEFVPDGSESPNQLDLRLPHEAKFNMSWRNSDVSQSHNLSKSKDQEEMQRLSHGRNKSHTQTNTYRNRLKNHIKNMQSSVTRNTAEMVKSNVEPLREDSEPEVRKKKQRGKSAVAAKSKPNAGTITDFYSNEISELITRTSHNLGKARHRNHNFLTSPGMLKDNATEAIFNVGKRRRQQPSAKDRYNRNRLPGIDLRQQRPQTSDQNKKAQILLLDSNVHQTVKSRELHTSIPKDDQEDPYLTVNHDHNAAARQRESNRNLLLDLASRQTELARFISDDNEEMWPAYLQDTISSFAARAIASNSFRKVKGTADTDNAIFKMSRITNPRVYQIQSPYAKPSERYSKFKPTGRLRPASVDQHDLQTTLMQTAGPISLKGELTKNGIRSQGKSRQNHMLATQRPTGLEGTRMLHTRQINNAHGKTSQFSSGFNSLMYQDTTLAGATRSKTKQTESISIKQQLINTRMDKFRRLQAKKTLVKLYQRHYGIASTQDDIENLSEKQLLIKLESKLVKKRENWAAIKIQALGRMLNARVIYLKILEVRASSATRIQNKYRNWRLLTLIPRIWRKHKYQAAFTIQKYLKGYQVFKHMLAEIRMKKFDVNYEHFAKMREEQKNESQALIRHVYTEWHERYQAKHSKKPRTIKIKKKVVAPQVKATQYASVPRTQLAHNNQGFQTILPTVNKKQVKTHSTKQQHRGKAKTSKDKTKTAEHSNFGQMSKLFNSMPLRTDEMSEGGRSQRALSQRSSKSQRRGSQCGSRRGSPGSRRQSQTSHQKVERAFNASPQQQEFSNFLRRDSNYQSFAPIFEFSQYTQLAKVQKATNSEVAIMIYSYAFEFHQALAIITMICKGGKYFAWGDGLAPLKKMCTESEKLVVSNLQVKAIELMIDGYMSTTKRLCVQVPYTTRKSCMQVPSNEDLRKMLALQIRGQRSRISSVKNQYSNMLERTTKIHITEEDKKIEVVTELVDKVPGAQPQNFHFPGEVRGIPGKEGVQLFKLYVVPQSRLAIHHCFVRSVAIPKYQTDILNIDIDVKITSVTFTLDKKNKVKNITYKDQHGKMFSTSDLTGLKPSVKEDFCQQTLEDLEKTDRKMKYAIPDDFEVVAVHISLLPDFISKEEVERMKHAEFLRKPSPIRHKKMPEIIPRQMIARRKESLPDCRDQFEQEQAVLRNVTQFQAHSHFFVKKGTAIVMDGVFDQNPPMPQVAEWMKLMEPSGTRMPIVDFVIMQTPTQKEISRIAPRLNIIQKTVQYHWRLSKDKCSKMIDNTDLVEPVTTIIAYRQQSPRKSSPHKKPQLQFNLFNKQILANNKLSHSLRYKLPSTVPSSIRQHETIPFDGDFRKMTIKEEIEDVIGSMQESARRTFKEIKRNREETHLLTVAYDLSVRAVGVIWNNYLLLSCYCHHKSNLMEADQFDLAKEFYKKELKKKTGEIFPDEDYIAVAKTMMSNPYKHLARMILLLNMELENEDVPDIPEEILENVRQVTNEYNVKRTKFMLQNSPLVYECQAFNELILKIHTNKSESNKIDKINDI